MAASTETKRIAADLKAERPDVYLAVTGEPAWADAVGHAYHAAEARWLMYVERALQAVRS